MKVVSKTGLVPVLCGVTGSIFGIEPEKAIKLLATKRVALVPIPEEIETYDFGEPVVDDPVVVNESQATDGLVPEDWRELHHLPRIKLAKEIYGGDLPLIDGEKPAQAAIRVIEDYLAGEKSETTEGEQP